MSRSALHRDRIAIVVLLLAAATWFVATRCGPWGAFLGFGEVDYALTPQPEPRGIDWVPLPIANVESVTIEQILTAVGSILGLALLATAIAAWRLRRPLSRRLTRLPVRIGLLAVILGVVADAKALTNGQAVFGWLGWRHSFGTDYPAGFEGAPGLLAGGVLLALGGIALTTGLALASRRSTPPEGETP